MDWQRCYVWRLLCFMSWTNVLSIFVWAVMIYLVHHGDVRNLIRASLIVLGWRTCKSTYVGTLLYSLELPFFLHRNQYKFLSAIYNCLQQPMLGNNIGLYKIKSSHIKYDIPIKASKIYYFLEIYITHKQNLHISLFVYNCPLTPPMIVSTSTTIFFLFTIAQPCLRIVPPI